jgi:hypothetical protein
MKVSHRSSGSGTSRTKPLGVATRFEASRQVPAHADVGREDRPRVGQALQGLVHRRTHGLSLTEDVLLLEALVGALGRPCTVVPAGSSR